MWQKFSTAYCDDEVIRKCYKSFKILPRIRARLYRLYMEPWHSDLVGSVLDP
jgi:hypothetical protein